MPSRRRNNIPTGSDPSLFPIPKNYNKKYGEQNVAVVDRLRTLRETYGFMPTSVGEINSAFALLSFIGRPGGAAKQLSEISIHQGRASTTQPEAAVRRVTNEYAGYALKARADRSQLLSLQRDLTERTSHNFDTLQGAGLIDGVAQLVRYHDLRQLADMGTVDIDPFITRLDGRRSALDPYTTPEPTADMKVHMQDVLGGIRVWEAEYMIEGMLYDQDYRMDFWAERLQEARQHITARPIAAAALQSLGFTLESA